MEKETDHELNEDREKDRIEDLETEVHVTAGGDEAMKTPSTTTTATLRLFALLFQAGAYLDKDLIGGHFFSGQTLRFLLDTIRGPRSDWLINSGFLSRLTNEKNGKYAHEDVTLFVKSVLNREYSDNTRKSNALFQELRSALFGALTPASPNTELIEILLRRCYTRHRVSNAGST